MTAPFAAIQYGPFQARYHVQQVSREFKEMLEGFLSRELLPQVTLEYVRTEGTLKAAFDDQRYCGPNSLVKDIYRLEFSFVRDNDREHIKVDLIYRPQEGAFAVRQGKSLYLWSIPRQSQHRDNQRRISEVLTGIGKGGQIWALCPMCNRELRIVNGAELLDVRCPDACFVYHMHKNPQTGEALHGHSRLKEPS